MSITVANQVADFLLQLLGSVVESHSCSEILRMSGRGNACTHTGHEKMFALTATSV